MDEHDTSCNIAVGRTMNHSILNYSCTVKQQQLHLIVKSMVVNDKNFNIVSNDYEMIGYEKPIGI